MGSSQSTVARTETLPPPAEKPAPVDTAQLSSSSPPPALQRPVSITERVWTKVKERPLLPIGCGVTAYFLISGIRYFQLRDPVNSQKMMRKRVTAQFMTLCCLLLYLGGDQADFRLAPMYQDKIKRERESNDSPESK